MLNDLAEFEAPKIINSYVSLPSPITTHSEVSYPTVDLLIELIGIYAQALTWIAERELLGGFLFVYDQLSSTKKELFLEAVSDIELIIYGDGQGDVFVGLGVK